MYYNLSCLILCMNYIQFDISIAFDNDILQIEKPFGSESQLKKQYHKKHYIKYIAKSLKITSIIHIKVIQFDTTNKNYCFSVFLSFPVRL